MGIMGGSTSKDLCSTLNYTPGTHPGLPLLPPSELLKFPTLPASVLGKISFDGLYYDHYGKIGVAFEDSMISAPDGRAKTDYEEWLKANPDIAREIDASIKAKKNEICQTGEGSDISGLEELTPDQAEIMKRDHPEVVQPAARGAAGASKKEEVAKYKKDSNSMGDMFKFTPSEWLSGKSEKDDRDKMVVDIFADLNN